MKESKSSGVQLGPGFRMKKEITRVSLETLEQLVFDILSSTGVDTEESKIIARVLVWNNLIGRSTQGVWRLSAYIDRFKKGLIKSPCHPKFISKSETIYILKGNDGFGHYLGHIGMGKAIEISDRYGVGLVGVCDSNHFGTGAYYIQMAAQNHKLAWAVSNSYPRVAPHGGLTAALGTNPFAFGAPTRQGQSILVDFSTGALAGSTIKKAVAEKSDIPRNTVIDANGNYVVNPNLASEGTILPFGGAKGFCLGLMIEILSGVITDSAISHEIASLYKNFDRSSRVGHLFIAIDISRIMPIERYFDRMERLINFLKSSKKKKEVNKILIPGETRWSNYHKQVKKGIHLDLESLRVLQELANELKLSTPW